MVPLALVALVLASCTMVVTGVYAYAATRDARRADATGSAAADSRRRHPRADGAAPAG